MNTKEQDGAAYSYLSTPHWDEALWGQLEPVYQLGFAEHSRKPAAIVKRLLEHGGGRLHAGYAGDEAAAMGISGYDSRLEAVVIDYLTVHPTWRGQGLGQWFLGQIRGEAERIPGCKGIIIEAEAEETPENQARIRFWTGCGFQLTDYRHSYIWVPEPYRAMQLSFDSSVPLPDDGEVLFGAITRFHERAYRR